jgi:hypothetical protein
MKNSAYTRAKNRAWHWFSKYIKLRDIKKTGLDTHFMCISCGKYKEVGVNCHAGHLVQGRRNSVLFDEDGVNAQCSYCNDHLKGNYAEYRKRLVAKIGEKRVQACEDKKHQNKVYTESDLRDIATKYRKKYYELEEK